MTEPQDTHTRHDAHDTHDLLEKLNPQQRAAVTTTEGPLLVVAGAGSGKTRVITHRIAWLIRERGAAPWEIFAATFTNKAAEEMRARVERLLPGADVARLSIATFHSLCVGILRREAMHAGLTPRFTICDDGDQMALLKDCLRNLDIPAAALRPERARDYIAAAKILMLGPEDARTKMLDDDGAICAKVYARYQERLRAGDAVDFDDLILEVVKIYQTHPEVLKRYQERWRYVLIDEYQDTNRVQFELTRLLAEGHGNICAVGDEDQSIYSWRGAEIENLLKFPDHFPGTQLIRLEQNYRSRQTILRAAGAVISHNRQRMGKELWSERGVGEPITLMVGQSEREEAAMVIGAIDWLKRVQGRPLRDIAIFFRVNALSRSFEDQLRQSGIPYRVIGGIKFYDRAEVKDLLAYLRLIVNPRDGVALARIINKPARGVGEKSLSALFNAAVENRDALWDRMAAIATTEIPGISGKAKAGILNLVRLVKDWQEYNELRAPHEMLTRILRDTNYEESLGNDDSIETISRRENVGELVTALEEFHEADSSKTLEDFLERIALVSAADEVTNDESVSLMTMHSAKGLEYGAVFIVGMEDPIFPSKRAVVEQQSMEEERRLFYVGITRARDLLFLSRADSRMFYGRSQYNVPSLFINEVPAELMRTLEDARRTWSEAARAAGREGAATRDSRSALASGRPVLAEARSGTGAREGRDGKSAPGAEVSIGKFAIGTRVKHSRLGEGQVLGASGEGQWRKVLICFDAGFQIEVLENHGGLEAVIGEGGLPF